MHVAIITTSYPDDDPGSEAAGSFVADFAQQLATQVRVTVIAAASATTRTCEGDVDVVRFAVPHSPLSLLRPLNPTDWPAIVKTIRRGRKALENFVQDGSPDYLFALWALPSGHWAASIARQYKIPFGIWALGSDIWTLGRVPLLRGKLRRVLRAAEHCFADGLKLAEDVEYLSGCRCQFLASTRRLPRPVHTSGAESAPYKLAFLGRWHANKGIDIFLDALRRLSDQDWLSISAVRLFGGGPLRDEVRSATAELQEQNRPIEVGGYLDKQHAADLIAWADYLVIPSRIESIPVIFSDAMQIGTPIVATPVGDLPQLRDKYDFGVLASAATADALMQAIREALHSNSLGFHKGLEAAAASFDIQTVASRFAAEIRGSAT